MGVEGLTEPASSKPHVRCYTTLRLAAALRFSGNAPGGIRDSVHPNPKSEIRDSLER